MSGMSLYRDPLAGLRSQIATKRGLLSSRELTLPELFRAMLPKAIGSRLVELKEQLTRHGEPESLDALTQLDATIDDLLIVHEEASQLVPKLRECPDDVPDPPRPRLAPPWVLEEKVQLTFRMQLTSLVTAIASDAWLVRWGDATYMSRLRVAGAPIIITSRFELGPTQTTRFTSSVRTSVPRSTPTLEVRHERLLDGVGRALGLVHDDKVGEGRAVFDERYVVNARPGAIALLTHDVTEALLAMDRLDARLTVGRGLAELVWGAELAGRHDAILPEDALTVVLGIRAAIERA